MPERWQKRFPDKHREKMQSWRKLNPRKYQAGFLRRYGLTVERFEDMLEMQAGLCAMCTVPMTPGKGTNVDHDHATGQVRGLVCRACNIGLGWFERVANDAVAYLEVSSSGHAA